MGYKIKLEELQISQGQLCLELGGEGLRDSETKSDEKKI